MNKKLPLFTGYGVELEYMIVDKEQLSVAPISDALIYEVAGEYRNEVTFEHIAWSNELVLHVIELKTNGPAQGLKSLPQYFQQEINRINEILAQHHARLLPTGAHPWMNPFDEARLWPHDYNIIYETYDRIFNCKGHGWSNLQSVHLNLPFANDQEFAKLHTAIRLLLPIIPALSASTPIIDGNVTGLLDTRLEFYRLNQSKYPSISGVIIPELVLSQDEYQAKILQPMYEEIASVDADKILQEEWLNSRGAITLFERNTIEIRIVDIQECPKADLAILDLIVAVLRTLIDEHWLAFDAQTAWSETRLQSIFLDSIKTGMQTLITDADYLTVFGLPAGKISMRDLWRHLLEEVTVKLHDVNSYQTLTTIIEQGNLAERILRSLKGDITVPRLRSIYTELAGCLERGQLFLPC